MHILAIFIMNIFAKENGWIHGLKIVAVAIVAHAILGMALKLTPDLKRKTIALFALVVALLWQTEFTLTFVTATAIEPKDLKTQYWSYSITFDSVILELPFVSKKVSTYNLLHYKSSRVIGRFGQPLFVTFTLYRF